jgi:hypothetical protein
MHACFYMRSKKKTLVKWTHVLSTYVTWKARVSKALFFPRVKRTKLVGKKWGHFQISRPAGRCACLHPLAWMQRRRHVYIQNFRDVAIRPHNPGKAMWCCGPLRPWPMHRSRAYISRQARGSSYRRFSLLLAHNSYSFASTSTTHPQLGSWTN